MGTTYQIHDNYKYCHPHQRHIGLHPETKNEPGQERVTYDDNKLTCQQTLGKKKIVIPKYCDNKFAISNKIRVQSKTKYNFNHAY